MARDETTDMQQDDYNDNDPLQTNTELQDEFGDTE